jgi:hypothetical protein
MFVCKCRVEAMFIAAVFLSVCHLLMYSHRNMAPLSAVVNAGFKEDKDYIAKNRSVFPPSSILQSDQKASEFKNKPLNKTQLVLEHDQWAVEILQEMSKNGSDTSSSYLAHISRVLQGCGEICDTSMSGQSAIFFAHIKKRVDCLALWSNAAIDVSRPPEVAPDIPTELTKLYTYNGRIHLSKRPLLINNSPSTEDAARKAYAGSNAGTPVWKKEVIDKWAEDCKTGRLEGNYGLETTKAVFEGLLRTSGVSGGRVLVIGSENPWVEACVLSAGATHVTTLEYGLIVSEHPQVSTLLPNDARIAYLNGSLVQFDAMVTFSSVEHSGLGRYGDQLNPWGDLQAMARGWCVCKPGGGLLLGVMMAEPDSKNIQCCSIYS